MTLYDEVEYPSRSFSQTHPARAAAIGTLLGMTPPSPASCRVLEVGCGSGWNLIPMAAALPEARFEGFDLAQSAIESAKRDAASLGLSNLRFEHLDLMNLPADFGQFDYIIAHGFYSWVPAPVRLKLLDLCQKHLAPNGLAFVSFNAYPYARLRLMWREMMLYHARHMGASTAQEQLNQSESLLKILAGQWHKSPKLGSHAELLDGQLNSISAGGGNWFFHDDLGPFFEPFSISEFSRDLECYGLQFAAEALFENLVPETQGADWIAREQGWDDLVFRGFHSTFICHQSQALRRPPDPRAFEKMHYAAPLTRVSQNVFRNDWTTSEAESEEAATLAVLERLAEAWPESLSFDELGATPETLLSLTLANVIEPCVARRLDLRASMTSSPKVWGPARLQAKRGKVVTNRLHAAIQLEQEPLRQLVIGLDGTHQLLEFQHLFTSQQALLEQVAWLHRAVLIQS